VGRLPEFEAALENYAADDNSATKDKHDSLPADENAVARDYHARKKTDFESETEDRSTVTDDESS